MNKGWALAGAVLLAACATAPSPRAAAVRDADARMVESCTYLGEVQDASGWGGIGGAGIGANNARNAARDDAAKMGATHVVWNPVSQPGMMGSSYTLASGRAYRCN